MCCGYHLSLSHTFALILPLSLTLSFPLSLSCSISATFLSSLILLCPSKAFQATVNCQRPSLTPSFMSGVCARGHMHVRVQLQCTHLHYVCTSTPTTPPLLKIPSYKVFIQNRYESMYQGSRCIAFFKT